MDSPVATAHRLLTEAVETLSAAAGSGAATDSELLSALTICEGLTRRLDRLTLSTISTLARRGTFADRGYKSTAGALSDLLGWEAFEARRRVHAADQVCPRIGLDGTMLPPRLAATAAVFEAGHARLRHVELIARLLDSPARLTPDRWAGAEATLAAKVGEYTPSGLQSWGAELIEKLDEDGPEPDDRPPAPITSCTCCRTAAAPAAPSKGTLTTPPSTTPSPHSSTPKPRRAPATTSAAPRSGRPKHWPRYAGTCSTTATSRNVAGGART